MMIQKDNKEVLKNMMKKLDDKELKAFYENTKFAELCGYKQAIDNLKDSLGRSFYKRAIKRLEIKFNRKVMDG